MPGTKGGIGEIQASLNGLSPKLRSIAEHILKHSQDVVHKSITELAEVTNSSDATIFRLCKHLGFQDLKITLAREIVHTPMQNIHEEVSAEDSMVTVAKKVFHSHITGLQDTLHLLNETALEQAVCILQLRAIRNQR